MKVDLKKYNACEEAIDYLDSHNGDFTKAWEKCHRGDWMLWIATNLKIDIRILTLAKGRCAETVMHLMTDARSINAVEVAIDFGLGKATPKELGATYAAAADAAYAYTTAYAYATAYATAAARRENRKLTSDICRDILTKTVFEKLNDNDKEI